MFATITSISNYIVNIPSTLTQSDTVQTIQSKVTSLPTQTKEYFYPSPPQYEMKSVVRLDDAFFVHKDIEEYITPGTNTANTATDTPAVPIPVKPSGNAANITSWHDFELCVEDETLFDETEMGSYTTTNYSVTTGTQSQMSPHYNIIKQSTLNKLNAFASLEDNLNSDAKTDINLNLDEDNGAKLFENLHKFRKSFIAKRKASGVHDLNDQSDFSAPPTSKSDGSYHRRLETLDLDALDLDKMNLNLEHSIGHSTDDEKKVQLTPEQIAPQLSYDNKPDKSTLAIQHAIEGSRELGIVDIGIINYNSDEESDGGLLKSPKHIKNISISKKQSVDDEEQVEFDLDMGDDLSDDEYKDEFGANDESSSGQFMKLQNRFSVQRQLHKPRMSMTVTQISVTNEERDTLIHQKSISQGVDNLNLPNVEANELNGSHSSQSSVDCQLQNEIGDYVKRVSLTPRGLDPDNAKVFVMEDNSNDRKESYDNSAEFLKSKNSKQHRRNDSMDTQPDANEQAPYMSQKQLSVFVREELNEENKIDIMSSGSSDKHSNIDTPPPPLGGHQQSVLIRQESAQFYDGQIHEIIHSKENEPEFIHSESESESNKGTPQNTEGWEKPTGYIDNKSEDIITESEDEKYISESYISNEDGYDETTHTMTTTTMGGINTFGGYHSMPYNENEYLPQELEPSYNERVNPRFGIDAAMNGIVRLHLLSDSDCVLKSDAIIVPITEQMTPIHSHSHHLMNSAGSQYLEHIYANLKGELSTGDAQWCEGYALPCQYIINCVPPKYSDAFAVASENAMHSSILRSLQIAADLPKVKTLVFAPVFPNKFFSIQLAIHILARTVRRFLEKMNKLSLFTAIVLCIDNESEMQLYTRIFTVYFPRDSIDLKYSQKYMPFYTGDVNGGTTVQIRKALIELSPIDTHSAVAMHRRDYETYDIYGNLRESIAQMSEFKCEPIYDWLRAESQKWQWQKLSELNEQKYKRYWQRCRSPKVSAKLNYFHLYQFVYVGGQDRDGRQCVIFVGNRFPQNQNNHNNKLCLLYVIRELHHIVDRDYSLIYLHSFVDIQKKANISWINQSFLICANRFQKNLHRFYVIHPDFRLKSMFYLLSTKVFYQKLVYCHSITELERNNVDLEHIALPGKSWERERELFGEDCLADKMALATDDLVLNALPYR